MRYRPVSLGAVFLAVLMAGGCSTAVSDPKPDSRVSAAPLRKAAPNKTIAFLEDRINRLPRDFVAHNKLAQEYLQHVRETGDVSFLDLAFQAARKSVAIEPPERNLEGLAVLVQVEYASHDFIAARDHAELLTRLDPQKGYPFQLYSDALLELGEYEKAADIFRTMEELGGIQAITKVAMHQRLARMARLRGEGTVAARHLAAALKLAESSIEPRSETVAWCRWQIGETAFAEGDYTKAERYYRSSLEAFPEYHRAMSSLGKVLAAKDDLAGAIELFEKVTRRIPDPKYVATLGDLYQLADRQDDAGLQYELVEKIAQLTGSRLYNRELALFYADHDFKPGEAYTLASREYEWRRDVYGADALAWTALKAGRPAEARSAMKEAMRLGTRDAVLFYHAGMIEHAVGNKVESRKFLKAALDLNPSFDPLQARHARKILQELP